MATHNVHMNEFWATCPKTAWKYSYWKF